MLQLTDGPKAVVTWVGSYAAVYVLRTAFYQGSFQTKEVVAAVIVHTPVQPGTVGGGVKVIVYVPASERVVS